MKKYEENDIYVSKQEALYYIIWKYIKKLYIRNQWDEEGGRLRQDI